MRRALIVGSAPGVHDDLALAPAWPRIVINYAGIRDSGPIEMWVSLHFRLLVRLIEERESLGCPMNFEAFTKLPSDESHIMAGKIRLRQAPNLHRCGNGSSGLMAVLTAIGRGYDDLLLCGVPLDGNETIQDDERIVTRTQRKVPAFERFRHAWVVNKDFVAPHVRSMSGWTRDFFGGPEDWVKDV